MGMERVINFAAGPPTWEAIQREASAAGLPISLRMIDGLPAFPDEVPAPDWRELRVGAPSGMMTLRRHPDRLEVVVWGNADEKLRHEWEQLVACLERP